MNKENVIAKIVSTMFKWNSSAPYEDKTHFNDTLRLQSNSKHVNIADSFYLINCNEVFIFQQLKHKKIITYTRGISALLISCVLM